MRGDGVDGSESFSCFTRWLCQVVYERQVSLLQFCSRQTGQGVGVVQLFTVVSGEQVWIQTNHMGGICAELSEHLHGVIESLLTEQIEGIEILDVVNLLSLISFHVILHIRQLQGQFKLLVL